MPMEWLPNRREIGPLARIGRPRRVETAARPGLPEGERLVPVALGGIPMRLPLERPWRLPTPPRPLPDGVDQAVEWIERSL